MIKRVRDLGGDIHENAVYTVVLQMPVVLRGACLFTIWLGLLKKNENDFSTSFSLIELSQSI